MSSTPQQPVFKSFIIAPPVQEAMDANPEQPIAVIISFQESKKGERQGISAAKATVRKALEDAGYQCLESDFYLFAQLKPEHIRWLAEQHKDRIYQIWKDEEVSGHLLSSTNTIKAAACWRTFEARGKGITWAVLDTGIHAEHPHFKDHDTVIADRSRSFVAGDNSVDDKNGHGTHVAGIIAGFAKPMEGGYKAAQAIEGGDGEKIISLEDGCPSGVAPLAKLVNVRVLNQGGTGSFSAVIMALEYVRKINEESRDIQIDGANLSLGVTFDPKLYGCGHSPLCEEVTRAVRSGLIVVISCGNEGYGTAQIDATHRAGVSIGMSISDPANAEEAIAVGSVHKSSPHTYGVSYFSSKGPTGDGRMKPDLVAPGEKVISCSFKSADYQYEEMSGTSMAAPHVSGAIAAFLSVYKEYRGQPRSVKEIFMKTATDLGRDRSYQGAGIVDLMRAIMSV